MVRDPFIDRVVGIALGLSVPDEHNAAGSCHDFTVCGHQGGSTMAPP
jgi:hypothetical protein